MSGGRLRVPAVLAAAAAIAGCGASASQRTPALSQLPLVPGTSIAARATACDQGANAFCAVELVLVGPRYRSSDDLLRSERLLLKRHGWSGANADTGEERAADSPGHRLRVTFATAFGDLKGIDFGWIKRPRQITLALSHTLFARQAALSIMLEEGSA